MDHSDIAKRMKAYERCAEWVLPRRIPVIVRIDGRSFHGFTKGLYGKRWSPDFVNAMNVTAQAVMADMQGCDFCYCQSDEISFLLTDYRTVNTQPWFGYDVRKMMSISASMASVEFCRIINTRAYFDSRCFSVPQDDVCNYFIWRQQDATRNAIQMAGREYFSHKQLHKKSCNDIQEMLFQEHGINFNDYLTVRKRGFCLTANGVDMEIPIFTQDREYIEKWVYVKED